MGHSTSYCAKCAQTEAKLTDVQLKAFQTLFRNWSSMSLSHQNQFAKLLVALSNKSPAEIDASLLLFGQTLSSTAQTSAPLRERSPEREKNQTKTKRAKTKPLKPESANMSPPRPGNEAEGPNYVKIRCLNDLLAGEKSVCSSQSLEDAAKEIFEALQNGLDVTEEGKAAHFQTEDDVKLSGTVFSFPDFIDKDILSAIRMEYPPPWKISITFRNTRKMNPFYLRGALMQTKLKNGKTLVFDPKFFVPNLEELGDLRTIALHIEI
jgi:hypothetical protein